MRIIIYDVNGNVIKQMAAISSLTNWHDRESSWQNWSLWGTLEQLLHHSSLSRELIFGDQHNKIKLYAVFAYMATPPTMLAKVGIYP